MDFIIEKYRSKKVASKMIDFLQKRLGIPLTKDDRWERPTLEVKIRFIDFFRSLNWGLQRK